jgi:hypothetical protein
MISRLQRLVGFDSIASSNKLEMRSALLISSQSSALHKIHVINCASTYIARSPLMASVIRFGSGQLSAVFYHSLHLLLLLYTYYHHWTRDLSGRPFKLGIGQPRYCLSQPPRISLYQRLQPAREISRIKISTSRAVANCQTQCQRSHSSLLRISIPLHFSALWLRLFLAESVSAVGDRRLSPVMRCVCASHCRQNRSLP